MRVSRQQSNILHCYRVQSYGENIWKKFMELVFLDTEPDIAQI